MCFLAGQIERQPGRRDIQRRRSRYGDDPGRDADRNHHRPSPGRLVHDKCRASHGQNDDAVLFIKATSRQLNPTLDQAIIDAAMARDPAAARAEYYSEWRDDLAQFLSRELIEQAVDFGVKVRPRIPGVTYRGFMDPSGGVSDSFAVSVAHAEGETIILDCLLEIAAPFNPTAAIRDVAPDVGSLWRDRGYFRS